jgi:very-short-patch-repair endonuclease
VKFRRQFSVDNYILDFYAPEQKLAVEADGGQHYAEAGMDADKIRKHFLLSRGIKILRFSNGDILLNTKGVCEVIHRALREIPPHLSPLPSGERK